MIYNADIWDKTDAYRDDECRLFNSELCNLGIDADVYKVPKSINIKIIVRYPIEVPISCFPCIEPVEIAAYVRELLVKNLKTY